jgi:integrase
MNTQMGPPRHPTSTEPAQRRALQKAIRHIYKATIDESSQRTYTSYVRNYRKVCLAFHQTPFPATRTSLALYAAYWLTSGRCHRTLKPIMSAIRSVHTARRIPWLSETDRKWMKAFYKGAQRLFPRAVNRKKPLTLRLLYRIAEIASLHKAAHTQYVTMAFVAHAAMLRATEVMSLQIRDVKWGKGYARLRIHKSKANKLSGEPEVAYLYKTAPLCALTALRAYWKRARLSKKRPTAFLFARHGRSTRSARAQWSAFLEAGLRRIGVNPDRYSLHSFRRGAASDAWRNKARAKVIQRFGRWKSEAVWLYAQDTPKRAAKEVARALAREAAKLA